MPPTSKWGTREHPLPNGNFVENGYVHSIHHEQPSCERPMSPARVATIRRVLNKRVDALEKELSNIVHAESRFNVQSAAELGEPKKPERFHIYSHGEMISRPPPVWIVPGLLPQAELAEIFGESGSGKSFFAYDLAAAIHAGKPWRGIATKQGRVLYVAAEGAHGMRERVAAYEQENPGQEYPPFVIDAPNLLDKTDAPMFVARLADTGPWSAIVIDTKAAVTPGANENDSIDMGMLLQYCKLLHAKTGALIILISHSGLSDKDRSRGWSGTKGALDAQICVTRNGDLRSWRCTKQKDAPDGPDGLQGHFKLKPVNDSCVIEHCEKSATQFASKGSEPSGIYELTVAEVLRLGKPVTMDTLRAHVKNKIPRKEGKKDFRGTDTGNAVKRLIEKGLAHTVDGTEGNVVQWHVIRGTDEQWDSIGEQSK
jgi:hypothetical protein